MPSVLDVKACSAAEMNVKRCSKQRCSAALYNRLEERRCRDPPLRFPEIGGGFRYCLRLDGGDLLVLDWRQQPAGPRGDPYLRLDWSNSWHTSLVERGAAALALHRFTMQACLPRRLLSGMSLASCAALS